MNREIFFDKIYIKDKISGELIDIIDLDIDRYSLFLEVVQRVKLRFELVKLERELESDNYWLNKIKEIWNE